MREIKEVFPYHFPDDESADGGDDAYHDGGDGGR